MPSKLLVAPNSVRQRFAASQVGRRPGNVQASCAEFIVYLTLWHLGRVGNLLSTESCSRPWRSRNTAQKSGQHINAQTLKLAAAIYIYIYIYIYIRRRASARLGVLVVAGC